MLDWLLPDIAIIRICRQLKWGRFDVHFEVLVFYGHICIIHFVALHSFFEWTGWCERSEWVQHESCDQSAVLVQLPPQLCTFMSPFSPSTAPLQAAAPNYSVPCPRVCLTATGTNEPSGIHRTGSLVMWMPCEETFGSHQHSGIENWQYKVTCFGYIITGAHKHYDSLMRSEPRHTPLEYQTYHEKPFLVDLWNAKPR